MSKPASFKPNFPPALSTAQTEPLPSPPPSQDTAARAARLAAIKARIAEGSYRIESSEVAAKLMDHLTATSPHSRGSASKRK